MSRLTHTTCPYCGVGCGVVAIVDEKNQQVAITGDASHPANFGRLCSKGAALADTLDHEGRLLHPLIDGQQATWDDALNHVAQGFSRIIAEHGADAVAFYVSGQLLTEDYYVANKLMKGYLGSANIDTNSRLCMSTAVAAHKRALGEDVVLGCYEDIEAADLVVIVGSNLAWAHPVLYQRLVAAKQARPALQVVVIDPRRTATCDIADAHLAIAPDTDAFLFNGLLHYLRREDALDLSFIEQHTEGFAATFAAARSSIPDVAQHCGLSENAVSDFFRRVARTQRTVTIFSQGINQSAHGVDKANAILNVHLATGRVGKVGQAAFSVTGQPNAMGGREVGGLANQLAAHLEFADADKVGRFWNAPHVAQTAGLKAVELFQAIAAGKIKAIWIMGTNPLVSLPDSDQMRAALQQCELVVVSDCVRHTDTTACADILLPAAAWGEKDGTVTNSERRISRQRAFLPPAGEAQPDWWIITQVAQRMGFGAAFAYTEPAQIFREHARLSGFENHGTRAFDLSGLATLDDAQYENLQPIQWPIHAAAPNGTARLGTDGRFFTASGKAQLIPITPQTPAVDTDFPLTLNSGRMRDQWHTLTRTGKAPRLNAHSFEPFAQLHPTDAAALPHGGLARLTSRHGSMLARVQISEDQRRGTVFVPMHWSDAFAKSARVNALVAPDTDPISGQPASKQSPVRLEAYQPAWQGFVLSRTRLAFPDATYCACSRGNGYWRHELAGEVLPADWHAWATAILPNTGEWIAFRDAAQGRYRAACLNNGQLQAVFFIAPDHRLPERDWLASLFTQLTPADLAGLLAARPPQGSANTGRTVCACFNIGETTLRSTIAEQSLTSVAEVGQCLKAGTGCGSCVPEIRKMLAS
jgi:assimilatory nitrate reductase catalytic subunit